MKHVVRIRVEFDDADLAHLAAFLKNRPVKDSRRATVRTMRDCLTSAIEARLKRLRHETELFPASTDTPPALASFKAEIQRLTEQSESLRRQLAELFYSHSPTSAAPGTDPPHNHDTTARIRIRRPVRRMGPTA